MASTVPPAYANVDWTQYQNWPSTVDPIDGKTYYQVAGVPGSYYDPTTDNVGTGTNLLPSMKLQSQKNVQKSLNPPVSTGTQIGQGLLPVVGTVGSAYAIHSALAGPSAVAAPGLTGGAHAGGIVAADNGVVDSSATPSMVAPGPVDGSTVSLPTAGAAPGGIVSGGGETAAVDPALAGGATPLYVPAAVALQTYLSGKSALNMIKGKTDNSISGIIGRVGLGIATGGLSEVANKFFGGHETTKQTEAKRWGELADDGVTGAAQQATALNSLGDMAGKEVAADGTVKKWNFNDALAGVKAGNTGDFLGVYGNYKTFGNDWSTYTPAQQHAIVAGLADAGLYYSNKGDVLISDADKARKIKDSVLAGTVPTAINTPTASASAGTPANPPTINPAVVASTLRTATPAVTPTVVVPQPIVKPVVVPGVPGAATVATPAMAGPMGLWNMKPNFVGR